MCTAICYDGKERFFGRTLDLEYHYEEEVVVTPRAYPLSFRHLGENSSHLAFLGMATMVDNTPLYYDGINECGVAIAGLRFADYAHYEKEGKEGLCVHEVIPYLLSRCKTCEECLSLLKNKTILDTPFRPHLPAAPLHWMIADKNSAYVIEPLAKGLTITKNPLGVLSNAPDFSQMLLHYKSFSHLTPTYRSQGADTLPGNWTSKSRFVRGAYLAKHMEKGDITSFFHLMDALAVPKGCSVTEDMRPTQTIYTCGCNLDKKTYTFTTHLDRNITTISLFSYHLDGSSLFCHKVLSKDTGVK